MRSRSRPTFNVRSEARLAPVKHGGDEPGAWGTMHQLRRPWSYLREHLVHDDVLVCASAMIMHDVSATQKWEDRLAMMETMVVVMSKRDDDQVFAC